MQVIEDMNDKFDRQSVERVTGAGYGCLYKLQPVSIITDGADQTDETARGLVVCAMATIVLWYITLHRVLLVAGRDRLWSSCRPCRKGWDGLNRRDCPDVQTL